LQFYKIICFFICILLFQKGIIKCYQNKNKDITKTRIKASPKKKEKASPKKKEKASPKKKGRDHKGIAPTVLHFLAPIGRLEP
jgi:hypothetical protein